MKNSIKRSLLLLSLLGANSMFSFACSCEPPISTFCESIGKDSEVLTIQIDAIYPATDSTFSSMTVQILEIVNGHAFDSLTTMKIFGSQNFGADCLATLANFSPNQRLMVSPDLMKNDYFLYGECDIRFLSLENMTVDYETARDSIIACSNITSIPKVNRVPTIAVYPNPVLDNLYFKSPTLITQIQVYDITGKLWLNKKINATEAHLPLQQLNAGMYFLYFIKEEERIELKKFIKK